MEESPLLGGTVLKYLWKCPNPEWYFKVLEKDLEWP
jgi:hypothetical protein